MDYTGIIIPFVGGLGMFIYGMQIMAQGLENAAGNKMKSLLEVLTKNKFFGVLLGSQHWYNCHRMACIECGMGKDVKPGEFGTNRNYYRCGDHADRKETFHKGYFKYHCWIWYFICRYFYNVRSSFSTERIRSIL